jgi:hypothetical protein
MRNKFGMIGGGETSAPLAVLAVLVLSLLGGPFPGRAALD